MGGDCLNRGCVPSKAILSLSKLAKVYKEASALGIKYAPPQIQFSKVMNKVKEAIKNVAPHDSVERYTQLGVECIEGDASLLSPWEVKVGDRVIKTRNIVLATGGSPVYLDIPGIDTVQQYSSDTIWDLKALPPELLVVGGGPIGSELALAFSRLGSKVSIVQRSSQLLPKEDYDVGKLALSTLTKEGIQVLCGARPVKVAKKGKTHTATILLSNGTKKQLSFTHMLVAAGRKAATDSLRSQSLEFEYNDNETLKTNKYLQTRYPNIYAVGDLTGPYQFTHMAGHMGWYAVVNALFSSLLKFPIDYSNVPFITYLSPEFARVGLNEKEAKVAGIPYEVYTYDMKESDRAIAERRTEGYIKVLTVPKKDTILGASIISERAGEMLGELLIAKKYKIGLNKILGVIHPYPSYGEAIKSVAGVWKKSNAPTKALDYLEKHFKKRLGKKTQQ
ncbi:mercuric reductase-like [Ylistrum balloti]|uniref:mercuric reductase-like n=1 Tax=Ylistrum balloti TaxID=509963 RepID=UPI002905CF86|nr:mercuric reductase-like [Ylistrum balloti]